MSLRFLLPLLSLTVTSAVGQGRYGPVTAHLKTGDTAPGIVFASLLGAPVSASWSQSNLSGKLTVLAFFPDTSHNLQPVSMWNELVEKFSGKPAQFLWITGEKESTLMPWINQHPIKGWVFRDPQGQTGRAYGLELPATVLIGADGRILGFDRAPFPNETLLNAALEGRTTITHPTKATLKAFLESNNVALDAEPPRMPRMEDYKPHFAPSFEVHVSPSEGEAHASSGGDTHKSLQGFTLKELVQELYNFNPIRIELPAAVAPNKHYDVAIVLPQQESREKMNDRIQQGLLDYFHLTVSRETRLEDVYVVTSLARKPPAVKPQSRPGMGSISSFSMDFEARESSDDALAEPKPMRLGSIRGVAMEGTAEEFCNSMESQLDRPVINETNLQGEYEFHVETPEGAKNGFAERLREKLGIVIAPSQRNVEVLAFRPR